MKSRNWAVSNVNLRSDLLVKTNYPALEYRTGEINTNFDLKPSKVIN